MNTLANPTTGAPRFSRERVGLLIPCAPVPFELDAATADRLSIAEIARNNPNVRAMVRCPFCEYQRVSVHYIGVANAIRSHLDRVHGKRLSADQADEFITRICECGRVATVRETSGGHAVICAVCFGFQEQRNHRQRAVDFGLICGPETIREERASRGLPVHPWPVAVGQVVF